MANAVRGAARSTWLTTADGKLVCLRALLRLAYALELLAGTQVEHAVQRVDELGRLRGAWKKGTDRQTPVPSACSGAEIGTTPCSAAGRRIASPTARRPVASVLVFGCRWRLLAACQSLISVSRISVLCIGILCMLFFRRADGR